MNMVLKKMYTHILLNREEAAACLGIDPVSFDKYFRKMGLKAFMLGKQERYLRSELYNFIRKHSVT